MTKDPSEGLTPRINKFADIKAKLRSLPPTERAAYEIRLAKEFGIAITPSHVASVGTASFGRTRIQNDIPVAIVAEGPGVRNWGGSDVEIRRSMATQLQAFQDLGCHPNPDELQRAFDHIEQHTKEYGLQSVASQVAELHAQLDALALRGDNADLVTRGRAALSRVTFRIPDSEAKSDIGSVPNH